MLTVHECQRFMSATAFSYVSLEATCPPSDADVCTAARAGLWQCSANTLGGLFKSVLFLSPNQRFLNKFSIAGSSGKKLALFLPATLRVFRG